MSEIHAPSKVRYSEECNDLIAALSAAQGEYPEIKKEREASVRGTVKSGPNAGQKYEYKYKFADISDVLAAVRPTNMKHGLAITQPTVIAGGTIYIYTRLMHKSGQWIESEWPVCSVTNVPPQDMGKSLTYSRRYAMCSLLGIQAEEDIDAQGGGGEIRDEPDRSRAATRQPPPQTVHSTGGSKPLPPRVGEEEPFLFTDKDGKCSMEPLSQRNFVSDLMGAVAACGSAGDKDGIDALLLNNTDLIDRLSEDNKKSLEGIMAKANKALRAYKVEHEHDPKPEKKPEDGEDKTLV